MSSNSKGRARPPIQIRETDAERISNLVLDGKELMPGVADLLLAEISRAKLIKDAQLPPDVVAMQSTVNFADDASGVERTLQLVYPHDADIEAGRISIMSLVGAGLLGLRSGQSISWPRLGGEERPLRIIKVTQG